MTIESTSAVDYLVKKMSNVLKLGFNVHLLLSSVMKDKNLELLFEVGIDL